MGDAETGPAERGEWRTGWPILVAAGFGLGVTSLYFYTLGLIIAPLREAFGWSQAQITAGPLIISFFYFTLGARVGAVVDRVGVRKVVLPGYAGFCIAFAMLGLAGPSIWSWYALWVLLALVFTTTAPSLWTLAVVAHFERARAMALSIALCSLGIMATLIPLVEAWAIAQGGWRLPFFVLGGGMLVIGMPVLWFCLPRTRRPAAGRTGEPSQAPAELPGLTFREALSTVPFWLIAATSLLLGVAIGALMVHLASIGLAKGLTTPQVARAASLIGVAAITGRLLSGYLMDRVPLKPVAAAMFAAPTIAVIILMAEVSPLTMGVAAMLIGFCSGGDFNALAMLTSRYMGMRNYAAIYGQVAAAFNIGVGVGPVAAGAAHDWLGAYNWILVGIGLACLVTAILTLSLGRLPQFGGAAAPATSS